MNNKGQSALEYLMTYGWALVVIVIVVAALFAFGVFNTPSNCTQTSGRVLVKDYAITANSISLSVQNGSTGTMGALDASINAGGFTGEPTAADLARSATTTLAFTSGTVTAGDTYVVTITYTLNGLAHIETSTCSAGNV